MDKPPDNDAEKITRGGYFSDLFFCDAYTILNVLINRNLVSTQFRLEFYS